MILRQESFDDWPQPPDGWCADQELQSGRDATKVFAKVEDLCSRCLADAWQEDGHNRIVADGCQELLFQCLHRL